MNSLQLHRRAGGVPITGVRLIAAIELAKGLLVVLLGIGFLRALGPGAEAVARELVAHSHLNPARHIPHIFLLAAEHVDNRRLQMLAAFAFAYALLRFVEAYGLWRDRAWAEWLAVVSGGIYLPYEVAELLRGVTPLRVATFTVNVAVVVYMALRLRARRTARALSA